MIKEAYEQGFLEACDIYGLDEDDMEVLGSVAEGLEKEAGIKDMYRATKGGIAAGYRATKGGIAAGYGKTKGGIAAGYGKTKGGIAAGYGKTKGGLGGYKDRMTSKQVKYERLVNKGEKPYVRDTGPSSTKATYAAGMNDKELADAIRKRRNAMIGTGAGVLGAGGLTGLAVSRSRRKKRERA